MLLGLSEKLFVVRMFVAGTGVGVIVLPKIRRWSTFRTKSVESKGDRVRISGHMARR